MKLPPFSCLDGNSGDCEDKKEGALVTPNMLLQTERDKPWISDMDRARARVFRSKGTSEQLEGAAVKEPDKGDGNDVCCIGEEERKGSGNWEGGDHTPQLGRGPASHGLGLSLFSFLIQIVVAITKNHAATSKIFSFFNPPHIPSFANSDLSV